MAPQFVDFNADGHVDIFTATFDGSPHVAYGSKDGFDRPQRILDANGERVLLTQFWNYDTTKWDDTGRTISDNTDGQLHCVSSVAFDWDNDGDFDLLLGDKNRGRLFRQMNEGSSAEPKFTGRNIPVLSDSKPFELNGGMTAPYLVDWDADGLMDLVCGNFGDSYGDGPGGGIFWYRNIGHAGDPQFAKPVTLIPPSPRGTETPTRPDSGLYVDVVDYNGDGQLDLVVGGYSQWTPVAKDSSEEQETRAAELQKQQGELINQLTSLQSKLLKESEDLTPDEANKKRQELLTSDEYRNLVQKYSDIHRELSELKPGPKREAFVWLYLRADANKVVGN
ncbi:MAG: FG-GAP-like repeat-containing protein [Planctomycetaceae bacterium]